MNEFLEQFLLESRELVELATNEMLALEKEPDNRERLDSAFRAFHTLKGGAGIVDFMAMSRAVHAAEDALSAVRGGQRTVNAQLIGDCLSCLDQVVVWLDAIEAAGDIPATADATADLIIRRFAERDNAEATAVSSPAPAAAPDPWPRIRDVLAEQIALIAVPHQEDREGRWASAGRVAANILRHLSRPNDADEMERALEASQRSGDPSSLSRAIQRVLDDTDGASGTQDHTSSRADAAARTLRVDASRVDDLVNLTGELTVVKNAIAHIARLADENANPLAAMLKEEHGRFDRLVARLQHAVLNLRVLPLRPLFQRFTRVVRELSLDLDKPMELVIEGDDTDADKAIVEMLFEPLLHVVRNAADHGIESRAARLAAGKPETATIKLSALREGEHVIVEVRDDGRGIDRNKVRQVALERGIATQEVIDAMTDEQIDDLLFAPGFSTAGTVTDLSGRGVGLDAVRSAVEQIGGRVSIDCAPGFGCSIRFTLPFSVMMTRVMTVEAGGQMFGIPLDAVVETVRLPRERIQAIGSAGAFVLRDRTIPLLDLSQTLGRDRDDRPRGDAIAVITSVCGQLSALEVDRLGERMDVMLKPIEGLLAGTAGIAGTTLMGDGQVLLILDLHDLIL